MTAVSSTPSIRPAAPSVAGSPSAPHRTSRRRALLVLRPTSARSTESWRSAACDAPVHPDENVLMHLDEDAAALAGHSECVDVKRLLLVDIGRASCRERV